MVKRVLALCLLLLVLLVGAVGAVFASTFAGNLPLKDGQSYGDGRVITVVDGYVACFLIDGGAGRFVLVDACQSADAAAISAALAQRGAALSDIALVLLTHGHSDHIGGLAALSSVPVRAAAAELPFLEGSQVYGGPIQRVLGAADSGVRVTHPLADGERLTVGDLSIQAFLVPGHTQGSAAFLVGDVLLLGDNASTKQGGELVGAPWVFSDDTDQNVASLAALEARLRKGGAPVSWLLPAHTGPAAGLAALGR